MVDPRDVRRILHPLPEILLLVVCGTIADCDDYEDIAGRGAAQLDVLRRYLHGEDGERSLTILMNRINLALFAAAFADCPRVVRALAVETHENRLEANRHLNMDDLREHNNLALRTAG